MQQDVESFRYTPKSDIAESRGRSIISFLGTHLSDFHNSYISLYTQQQWMSVSHLCQNKLCKFCMVRLFLIHCQYFTVLSSHKLNIQYKYSWTSSGLEFFHYMIKLDNLDKGIFHVTTNLFVFPSSDIIHSTNICFLIFFQKLLSNTRKQREYEH